ncbi:ABC transporter ATP-binding protein [Streptomyces sp. CA2R101]|uniref:ABC transporter ATP-binding protein n=1 Tax=Streptomyces sp. CA2R101 TaxID=3120152 RepID=UPI0030092D2A
MTPLLQFRDLWYHYPGDRDESRAVLRGTSACIGVGESVGIVGRNGSGKSTLLKVLANLLRPTAGEVHYHGRRVRANDQKYRSLINYCAGAPQGFYPRLTATENLRFFSGMKGRMYTVKECATLLKYVGLGESVDVKYSKFSLGMRQRMHLACLLIEPSDIWILDEPTTGLDSEGMEMLEKLLVEMDEKAKLVVSHDAGFLQRVTTRRLVLDDGALACPDSCSS